jgi:hypothetical protein
MSWCGFAISPRWFWAYRCLPLAALPLLIHSARADVWPAIRRNLRTGARPRDPGDDRRHTFTAGTGAPDFCLDNRSRADFLARHAERSAALIRCEARWKGFSGAWVASPTEAVTIASVPGFVGSVLHRRAIRRSQKILAPRVGAPGNTITNSVSP